MASEKREHELFNKDRKGVVVQTRSDSVRVLNYDENIKDKYQLELGTIVSTNEKNYIFLGEADNGFAYFFHKEDERFSYWNHIKGPIESYNGFIVTETKCSKDDWEQIIGYTDHKKIIDENGNFITLKEFFKTKNAKDIKNYLQNNPSDKFFFDHALSEAIFEKNQILFTKFVNSSKIDVYERSKYSNPSLLKAIRLKASEIVADPLEELIKDPNFSIAMIIVEALKSPDVNMLKLLHDKIDHVVLLDNLNQWWNESSVKELNMDCFRALVVEKITKEEIKKIGNDYINSWFKDKNAIEIAQELVSCTVDDKDIYKTAEFLINAYLKLSNPESSFGKRITILLNKKLGFNLINKKGNTISLELLNKIFEKNTAPSKENVLLETNIVMQQKSSKIEPSSVAVEEQTPPPSYASHHFNEQAATSYDFHEFEPAPEGITPVAVITNHFLSSYQAPILQQKLYPELGLLEGISISNVSVFDAIMHSTGEALKELDNKQAFRELLKNSNEDMAADFEVLCKLYANLAEELEKKPIMERTEQEDNVIFHKNELVPFLNIMHKDPNAYKAWMKEQLAFFEKHYPTQYENSGGVIKEAVKVDIEPKSEEVKESKEEKIEVKEELKASETETEMESVPKEEAESKVETKGLPQQSVFKFEKNQGQKASTKQRSLESAM